MSEDRLVSGQDGEAKEGGDPAHGASERPRPPGRRSGSSDCEPPRPKAKRWPPHPLCEGLAFEDRGEVKFIGLRRRVPGRKEYATGPSEWDTEALRSTAAIADLYGGGDYKVVLKDKNRTLLRVWPDGDQWIKVDGESYPLVPREQAQRAANVRRGLVPAAPPAGASVAVGTARPPGLTGVGAHNELAAILVAFREQRDRDRAERAEREAKEQRERAEREAKEQRERAERDRKEAERARWETEAKEQRERAEREAREQREWFERALAELREEQRRGHEEQRRHFEQMKALLRDVATRRDARPAIDPVLFLLVKAALEREEVSALDVLRMAKELAPPPPSPPPPPTIASMLPVFRAMKEIVTPTRRSGEKALFERLSEAVQQVRAREAQRAEMEARRGQELVPFVVNGFTLYARPEDVAGLVAMPAALPAAPSFTPVAPVAPSSTPVPQVASVAPSSAPVLLVAAAAPVAASIPLVPPVDGATSAASDKAVAVLGGSLGSASPQRRIIGWRSARATPPAPVPGVGPYHAALSSRKGTARACHGMPARRPAAMCGGPRAGCLRGRGPVRIVVARAQDRLPTQVDQQATASSQTLVTTPMPRGPPRAWWRLPRC